MSDTRVQQIWEETYLINTYYRETGLSFNQYVVTADDPMLVHTGSVQTFDDVISGIEQVCAVEDLAYAFITHFESDECGALSTFLDRNPTLTPVCSEITARQLSGFGIHDHPVVVEGGETLDLGDRTLEFLDYPAEMHLWNGSIAYDPHSGGLFSSDLFRRRGEVDDLVVHEPIDVADIPADRVPEPESRADLAADLDQLDVRRVAPGHGPVIDCSRADV